MIRRKLLVALGLGLASTSVVADHPATAFGSEAAAAINTISAKPMPRGKWSLGIRTEIIDNKSFSSEQLESFAAQGMEGVHSVGRVSNTSVSLAYGVSENLTVLARLPYIERTNIREAELDAGVPTAHVHGDSSGFGDLSFLGQYRFFRKDRIDASILFGLKAPTGSTNVKDIEGVRFETEFQPGTASWDFLGGAAIAGKISGSGLHASILYSKTTEGSQATRLGDALSYSVAWSYRLGRKNPVQPDSTPHHHADNGSFRLDLCLELNGETRRKDTVAGAAGANTGGTAIYLSPGIKVSSNHGLGGFLSIGIPVVNDQNGTQAESDIRVVAGLSFSL